MLCREDLWGSRRDDDINLEPDELGRDFGEALVASLRPAILDRDGATLDPTEFTKSPHKSSSPWAEERSVRAQKPDGRQLPRLWLRLRRQRPCRRAAKHAKKIAPLHVQPQARVRAS